MEKTVEKLLHRFRIEQGAKFRLRDHAPDDTAGLDLDKDGAAALLAKGVEYLSTMQDMLYAQDRWAVLCIFQAMDAAGKDSAIKHVFSGVNPQGCHVVSFKAPTAAELDQDFLRRHIARTDRHPQPILVRGGAGGARPPGDPGAAEAAAEAGRQAHLRGTARGHRRP
jgi:polyphosphate kinase 2 (PPK2 family)